jgi:hypothetical protein
MRVPARYSQNFRFSAVLKCLCVGLVALLSATALAQAPVGTISGIVLDQNGAVVPNASITIKNKATGAERKLTSDEDGNFSAAALPAGDYEVRAEAKGFRTTLREYTVATGSIVRAEMQMEVGQATEIVTVSAAGAAQINYESHSVDGVITRQKIQELPLNGRSFLQLAFLEPGVTASPGTTSQYNSLFSVSVLGGDSNKTAITVDGGNVRNSIEGNTGMNFSQEVVQEFQLSSTNFDLSTGITSVGAVNIVTRSGGNQFHGSGYFFFRDSNMAAYPGLKRICEENPATPICVNATGRKGVEEPFFARRNPGLWVGGPIIKNRLFFFANYEHTNQAGVTTVQPDLPSIAGLAGNFGNFYRGHLFSLKFDLKLTDKHTLFARYSHDENKGFGPQGGAVLPSNWVQNTNFSDQTVLGFTSVFTPTLTNDFRGNYTYWRNRNLFADEQSCPGCLGLGFPQITLQGSGNFAVGNTSNATQGRDLRRFTFLDTLTWQKGSHRFRFGTELEYAPGTGFWGYCDPGCFTLASPEFVRGSVPANLLAALFPNLPTTIRTNADLLNLPFLGGVVGIGNPGQPPPYNIEKAKKNNRMRFYGQDTWKVKPTFTLNYGLAWNFESTLVNRDLPKPQLLAPLLGGDLSPTDNNYKNFSPSFGFAWNVGKDNKTVVRGGAGIYWDTELLWRRLQERAFIGPLGNGRIQYPEGGFVNIFGPSATLPLGILDLGAGGRPVAVGAPVPRSLTNLTLGQFNQILAQQLATATQAISGRYTGDLSVRNIQISKSGAQLYPSEYPVQRSYHMNIGIQRELRSDMVLTVDYVRRVFVNTLLGELDYNRFNRFTNGVRNPVIPICANQAQRDNPTAQCSTGSFTFWTPGGRQVYNAMLLKLDKRFADRYLFTASYALTGQSGINGIVNLDNYFQSYGPQGARHLLNVSGLVDLPWGFQLGVISSTSSRGPFHPSISGIDLDGDGVTTEPLPGVQYYNCFNRACGKNDLTTAVQNWNAKYFPSGPPQAAADFRNKDARGQNIPYLILPNKFDLGDSFNSQDVRLTKTFAWKDRYKLSVFGEVFNVFNVANLSGFSGTIQPLQLRLNAAGQPVVPVAQQIQEQSAVSTFLQPTQRAGQVFGSGGPRALQLGARISF